MRRTESSFDSVVDECLPGDEHINCVEASAQHKFTTSPKYHSLNTEQSALRVGDAFGQIVLRVEPGQVSGLNQNETGVVVGRGR